MKKPVILILCCLSAFTVATSQTAQQSPVSKSSEVKTTIEQVLDRYMQALGGRAAIEKINSRVSKGTFTSANLKTKGPIELYAKAPNKQLMVLLAAGFGNYRRGFSGTEAWELYPGSSAASNLSGFSKRDAEFYFPCSGCEKIRIVGGDANDSSADQH
jgi:hypothetical protein